MGNNIYNYRHTHTHTKYLPLTTLAVVKSNEKHIPIKTTTYTYSSIPRPTSKFRYFSYKIFYFTNHWCKKEIPFMDYYYYYTYRNIAYIVLVYGKFFGYFPLRHFFIFHFYSNMCYHSSKVDFYQWCVFIYFLFISSSK